MWCWAGQSMQSLHSLVGVADTKGGQVGWPVCLWWAGTVVLPLGSSTADMYELLFWRKNTTPFHLDTHTKETWIQHIIQPGNRKRVKVHKSWRPSWWAHSWWLSFQQSPGKLETRIVLYCPNTNKGLESSHPLPASSSFCISTISRLGCL